MFNFTHLPRAAARHLRRLPLLALLVVALFVGAFAEGAFIIQAATERGCGLCHVPARAVEAAASGPHASTRCLQCHRTRGPLSLLELNVRAVRNLAAQLRPSSVDLSRAAVPTGTCLSCHEQQIADGPVTVRDVRMRHADVLQAEMPCSPCHARALHAVSPIRPGLDHGSCSSCHDGVTAGTACSVCHARDPQRNVEALPGTEGVIHREGETPLHGMGRLDSCPTCHARTFCASCHQVDLPHDMNSFPHLHGTQAMEAGTSACTACHRADFCDSCHQMPMPHPDGFLRGHEQAATEVGEAVCLRCHVSEDCRSCHDAHVHPDLPDDVLQGLRETGD